MTKPSKLTDGKLNHTGQPTGHKCPEGKYMSSPATIQGKVGEVELTGKKPKSSTKSNRQQWKKWKKLAVEEDNIPTVDGKLRSIERGLPYNISIVPVIPGIVDDAEARAPQSWSQTASSSFANDFHHQPSNTKPQSPPTPSYLDQLKDLAEPNITSPSSPPSPQKQRRRQKRRPRKRPDGTMTVEVAAEYIPPHRRQWNKVTSTPAKTNPQTAHPQDANGQKNEQQERGRGRQNVRFEQEPTSKPIDGPQKTPQPKPDITPQHSTISTKPGSGSATTLAKVPASPPSPPSSPLDDTQQPRSTGVDNATKAVDNVKKVLFDQAHSGPSDSNAGPSRGRQNNTASRGQAPNGRGNQWSGWDNSAVNSKTDWWNQKTPASRVNHRDSKWARPPKDSKWVKNSELRPKPVSDEDGGASLESHSNGDPDYDIRKLTDWAGNWLPAPVEWEGRRAFTDRNFYESIDKWIIGSIKQTTVKLDTSDPSFTAAHSGEMVPRYWIPGYIDGEPPQTFWRTYPARAPEALSDCGDFGTPWWETYQSAKSTLLTPAVIPEARLDPSDENYALAQKDQGADHAISQIKDKKREKARRAEERRKRKEQERSRVLVGANPDDEDVPDTSLKTKANIYIRPAYAADLPYITQIYNHYVTSTILAPEFSARTCAQMDDRLEQIRNNDLPFIVAIQRSNAKNANPGGYGQPLWSTVEKVVGFALVDDWCHPGSLYRYTVELETYVAPEYLHMGAGKCLVDKMLGLLDNCYMGKGGYDWVAKKDSDYNNLRIVKTINCNLIHESAGKDLDIEWKSTFLRSFGFKRAGHLFNMGVKCDKSVDVDIFQYTTSEDIPLHLRPVNPL